jgi:hypothetical protein
MPDKLAATTDKTGGSGISPEVKGSYPDVASKT